MCLSISYILSILDDELINELWPIIHQGIYDRLGKTIKILEEIKLNIETPKDPSKKEDVIELVLLGTDLIQAFYDYEVNAFKWLEDVFSSSEIVNLLKSTLQQIS